MKYNKGFALAALLAIIVGVLVVGGGIYWKVKSEDKVKFINFDDPKFEEVKKEDDQNKKNIKYDLPLSTINNVFSCELNKSYYAPYSFSSAEGPKIDYPCHCPTNSYIMNISSHTGMSVVLGNGSDKTIEYQCVKNFKVCSDGYKLTSYTDSNEQFTCTKN